MEKIQYKKLDADCFNTHSLDSFVRHQAVTECWREVDNKWVLVPNPNEGCIRRSNDIK